MSRLLFITLSNIGDLVMSTPALCALHAAYPDAAIDVVADPRSSELLSRCPFLGRLEHRVKRDGAAGMLALVRRLRRERYEAIVDLRTDFLPWLLCGRRRSARWQARGYGPHAVEQHYAVARRVLPAPQTISETRVWLGDGDLAQAAALLADLPGPRRLVLAPGANWPGKRWPAAAYAALAHELRAEFDALILLGNAADAAALAGRLDAIELPILDLMGRTSLLEAAAVMRQATLFVGNDSGLGHLASAAGLPSVTVFGPGRPERYRPWGARAKVVMAPDLDLSKLTAASVAQEVRALLAASAA
ncbi:MAG TPA: glycosyltransferase family 9 protein [Gammaproteobacteria bacterium]|nr:glycosyltransferase family 9 protein [Gammaproteobacteria bacterium]